METGPPVAFSPLLHGPRTAFVPIALHLCFGYAYVVKDKPTGYSFLPELEGCPVRLISIEAAQPRHAPAATVRGEVAA